MVSSQWHYLFNYLSIALINWAATPQGVNNNVNVISLYSEIFLLCTYRYFHIDGGNKRLKNVTKLYCQCQISQKRRKKECLGKFKFALNRLKK
jgi:hypothetical protein